MKPPAHLGLMIAAAALAACTTTTTSTDPSTALPPAASPPAASSPTPASSRAPTPAAPSAGADCAELEQGATVIATTVLELSRLVGTEKDAAELLGDVGGFAPTLGGLVPTCAPSAEDSMWAFLTAAEEMRQKFSSGAGKTEMGWSKLALIQVRAAGADLYERLGLDASGWATVPENARPGCRDAEAIATRLTWVVRHLANLIGSDDVTNAESSLVHITGLTAAIGELVADCRPRADTAMTSFEEAVDQLAAVYQEGTDPAVIEADKAAFGDLRAAGTALYSQLGLDASSWEVVPANER